MAASNARDEGAGLRLEISSDGLASVVFDAPERKLNILTSAVMERLDRVLAEIEANAAEGRVKAVVIRSGKPGSFIAGADVEEIASIRDEETGYAASREGQRIFRRLELLQVPTVAAIDGICLGGGTELILACGHRLASDRPETRIGLPEIRLGILPGFGGTTRLPRLVGLQEALGMILTGSTVNARKALRIGLVDEVVPAELLVGRAEAVAHGSKGAESWRKPRQARVTRLLDHTAPGRRLVLSQAKKKVLKETRGHYPAPLMALRTIRDSLSASLDDAFELEARALGSLIITRRSKNLIHVFRLMEAAKKAAPRVDGLAPVSKTAVVGAGVMGGGIAQLLAERGLPVRLKDINPAAIGLGLRHARERFDRAVQRRKMKRREADRRMQDIAPTLDYSGFGAVDFVIEAVVEKMSVKQVVVREVERRTPPGCTITSNTSTLSITEMQSVLEHPADFCGMHFFNPVHRMPLVEVIRGEQSSDATIARVFALARRLDKTPIIVNDGPGFLVNRILSPYLNEAGWLLADGATVEAIDEALLEFGMPMGPLRLLDEVGLDVSRHAGTVLHEAFGERMAPAPTLVALQDSGLLGRKGGRGFYTYEGDVAQGVNESIHELFGDTVPTPHRDLGTALIIDRTVLAMVNEAARVLEDGIVGSPGDVDLGMITGTGFPPFRGGLLRWADRLGLPVVLRRLETFARDYGERFEPARSIRERAAALRAFYD